MENKKLVGITSEITMSRTLYIEVPENASEEEVIDKAKQEILLPHNALVEANNILNRAGIRISGLDLKDWEVLGTKYNVI